MDYGKLAYLKAVDLEDRLNIQKVESNSVRVEEYKNLPPMCELTEISGTGDLAVFILCSQSAVFYVDGIRLCEGSNTFFKLSGGGMLTAKSETGIDWLRLMVIGNMVVSDRASSVFADYCDGNIQYMICENGRVSVYASPVNPFMPQKLFEQAGTNGDVCTYRGGFITAVLASGNITLRSSSGESSYLVGAEKVAISADDYYIIVAFLKDGKIYYFELNSPTQPAPVTQRAEFAGYVDDVRFVKGSARLLFSSGGKCYVKDISRSDETTDKLYVNMEAELL